jgi:cysteinyl-tRNA synthetase
MALDIYNVLTKKKEEFKSQDPKKVSLYACGITVSGDAHIGHARQALVYDMIRNYLKYLGYDVTYVRNYTDVDDKIIAKAQELDMGAREYAAQQIIKTDKDLRDLGVKPADVEPKVSETIPEIIKFTEGLIEKGFAYKTDDGDVYFKVDKFKDYGKLSRVRFDNNIAGVRKDVEEDKENHQDFALWKSAKPGEIYWDSPWGKGRPGWHIECSAMSMKFLGETIDIHGGGKDLVFPHHENEIAQSEALTGKKFVNYWTHCGLIKVNGQKMSKSLGNGITIRDLLDEYHPEVIRYALIQSNYKEDMNVTKELFNIAEKAIYGFYTTFNRIDKLPTAEAAKNQIDFSYSIKEDFEKAMNSDFNTSILMASLHNYITELNSMLAKPKNANILKQVKSEIVKYYSILDILSEDPEKILSAIKMKHLSKSRFDISKIQQMVEQRSQFKKAGDYANADKIRDDLKENGIIVKDSMSSVEWDIDFFNFAAEAAKGR